MEMEVKKGLGIP